MKLADAMTQPPEMAEYWYRKGIITQTEWDLYRFYWRNSAPRFSDLYIEFQIQDTPIE